MNFKRLLIKDNATIVYILMLFSNAYMGFWSYESNHYVIAMFNFFAVGAMSQMLFDRFFIFPLREKRFEHIRRTLDFQHGLINLLMEGANGEELEKIMNNELDRVQIEMNELIAKKGSGNE